MASAWNPEHNNESALSQCVVASRLLGQDPAMVLHGGGNTSVKDRVVDVTGEPVDVVHVKGSGWDLASIEEEGFAPLRIRRRLELAQIPDLDDTSLVNELRLASLRADAPTASIEAILHAVIPFRAVLHTHADAIVTLGDQEHGREQVQQAFGDDVLIIDYIKPGFGLARTVAQTIEELEGSLPRGIVLLKHGLFTFAETMAEAYENHLELVQTAVDFIRSAVGERPSSAPSAAEPDPVDYARLRGELSDLAGKPLVLHRRPSVAVDQVMAAASYPGLAQRGPITPEHVIRTKRIPCIGTDVAGYADSYRDYVQRHAAGSAREIVPLDPAPRVLLDRAFGLVVAGETVAAAAAAADIWEHTAEVILDAEAMGRYQPITESEAFEIEYWELEQAKLRKGGSKARYQGEVALVTGAASGIGRACALTLLAQGAAVIAVDRSAEVTEVSDDPRWLGVVCDVTDADAVRAAVERGVRHFGGLDILVPAAGVFAASAPISGLDRSAWDVSMRVNVDGLFSLLQAAHRYLALAPRGGRVVLIASKNVPAPGPGAAAYSASKAAATQLARVAALEWAPERIRVNMVNPDAVFDTGLWTPELLAERAAKYQLSIDEYKRRNLLRTEVTSVMVAEVVADLCAEHYSATTGAQIAIDGGSDRIV